MRINEWKAGDVISSNDGKALQMELERRYFHEQKMKRIGVCGELPIRPMFSSDGIGSAGYDGKYRLTNSSAISLNRLGIDKPKPSILSVIGGLFK